MYDSGNLEVNSLLRTSKCYVSHQGQLMHCTGNSNPWLQHTYVPDREVTHLLPVCWLFMYPILLNNMWRVQTGFEVGVEVMEAQFMSQHGVK